MPVTTKLGRVRIYSKKVLSIKSQGLWSRGLVKQREKLDPLYLYYHNAFNHQTWQEGNLLWEASHHKVIQPLNSWSSEVSW